MNKIKIMNKMKVLDQYNDAVRELGHKLRAYIMATLPDITEEEDIPANILGYTYGKGYKNVICTIIPSKKGIKLGFNKGASLPDPEQKLTGTGKVHKYVEIKTEEDISSLWLQSLMHEAIIAWKKRIAE